MAVTKNQLQLGRILRELRESRGLTQRDVETGTKRAINKTSLSNLESAKSVVSWTVCKELADHYGADKPTRARIIHLAQNVHDKGDWEDYTGFSDFSLYLSLEPDADVLITVDPEVVTGVLQTPDYARAVLEASQELDSSEIEHALAVRAKRADLVLGVSGPRLVWVTTEGALGRVVGSPEVHREQLDHLMDAVSDRVSIEVIPQDSGAYAGMRGGYTLMRFGQDKYLSDVAYVESIDGCRYIEDPDKVGQYSTVAERVRQVARPIAEVYDSVA